MQPQSVLPASAMRQLLDQTEHAPWWHDKGLRKVIFWQACIMMSQMIVGYDEVIVGSFQSMEPWVKDMGNPSASDLGLITAVIFVGGFFGALFASPVADRFGRRVSIFCGSGCAVIGSAMQAAAPGRGVFIGGRVVVGVGISLTTSAGPSLLNELAHPRLRGTTASFFNVLWYLGSIVAAWLAFGTGFLSTTWSWRIPSIVQAVSPLLVMIAVLFMPESPRWLCAQDRLDEARAVLTRYHTNGDGSHPLVALEMQEITEALEYERGSSESWAQVLASKAHRRRLGICVAVAVLTLWNGQGVISYYFSPILDSVGVTGTTEQTGINGGMAIWNLLCSLTGAVLADRVGRRRLWLASFIGMIAANIPLTVATAMYKDHGSQAAAYVVVVCLFLYNAAFNVACNPLLYCYTTEILPYSVRTRGLAVQVMVSQVALTVNQYVNPIAMERISYWYYVFYLGVLLFSLALIYFTFPETKGLSLEELSVLFEDTGYSSSLPSLEGQGEDTPVGTLVAEKTGAIKKQEYLV